MVSGDEVADDHREGADGLHGDVAGHDGDDGEEGPELGGQGGHDGLPE